MVNTAQQVKLNVILSNLEELVCPNCENPIFIANSSMFKKLPAIQSPTGKAQLVHVQLLTCTACNCSFRIKDDELLPIAFKKDIYEARKTR